MAKFIKNSKAFYISFGKGVSIDDAKLHIETMFTNINVGYTTELLAEMGNGVSFVIIITGVHDSTLLLMARKYLREKTKELNFNVIYTVVDVNEFSNTEANFVRPIVSIDENAIVYRQGVSQLIPYTQTNLWVDLNEMVGKLIPRLGKEVPFKDQEIITEYLIYSDKETRKVISKVFNAFTAE